MLIVTAEKKWYAQDLSLLWKAVSKNLVSEIKISDTKFSCPYNELFFICNNPLTICAAQFTTYQRDSCGRKCHHIFWVVIFWFLVALVIGGAVVGAFVGVFFMFANQKGDIDQWYAP